MPRILSDTQKKEIFKNIPSSFIVNSTEFTATKIWSNQKITGYPTISINISNDGIASDIRDIAAGILYYQSILTIHVLTEHSNGVNGAVIAEGIANDITTAIAGWTAPLTGDIRIFDPEEDIKPVRNLGLVADSETFDYTLSTNLYHS